MDAVEGVDTIDSDVYRQEDRQEFRNSMKTKANFAEAAF